MNFESNKHVGCNLSSVSCVRLASKMKCTCELWQESYRFHPLCTTATYCIMLKSLETLQCLHNWHKQQFFIFINCLLLQWKPSFNCIMLKEWTLCLERSSFAFWSLSIDCWAEIMVELGAGRKGVLPRAESFHCWIKRWEYLFVSSSLWWLLL